MIRPSTTAPPQARRKTSAPSQVTAEAARWFLESGIQNPAGGVARYYRTDEERLAPVSTELTGYYASALACHYRATGDERCLKAARLAGEFLTRTAWDGELATIPFELEPQGESCAYFFDLGIISRGLLALWRLTKDQEFLRVAHAAALSMKRDFGEPPGRQPVTALPSRRPLPGDARWSRNAGCYQLKAALAWLEAGEATGEEAMGGLYEAMLSQAAETEGAFLNSEPSEERVMDRLHAYCYFLEGLLPRAADPSCARLLRDGIRKVRSSLDAISASFERCDVLAQLLRLRLFAAALGIAPLDRDKAREEFLRVCAFQYESPDPRLRGGFCFGRRHGRLLPFANPAATTFAMQAINMMCQFEDGRFAPDFRDLV